MMEYGSTGGDLPRHILNWSGLSGAVQRLVRQERVSAKLRFVIILVPWHEIYE